MKLSEYTTKQLIDMLEAQTQVLNYLTPESPESEMSLELDRAINVIWEFQRRGLVDVLWDLSGVKFVLSRRAQEAVDAKAAP